MAIATLAECYRNPKVFTGVVKIRKGLAVRLLRDCAAGQDIRKYRWWFAHFAAQMRRTALAVPDGKGAACAEACARIVDIFGEIKRQICGSCASEEETAHGGSEEFDGYYDDYHDEHGDEL